MIEMPDIIVGDGRMVECFDLEIIFLKHFNLYRMKLLPEGLVDIIYKHKHEMLWSKVMKQLKTYRVNIVFLVSLEFLEYGYFAFGGVRTPCIDINNIDATSYELLCLINNDYILAQVASSGVPTVRGDTACFVL